MLQALNVNVSFLTMLFRATGDFPMWCPHVPPTQFMSRCTVHATAAGLRDCFCGEEIGLQCCHSCQSRHKPCAMLTTAAMATVAWRQSYIRHSIVLSFPASFFYSAYSASERFTTQRVLTYVAVQGVFYLSFLIGRKQIVIRGGWHRQMKLYVGMSHFILPVYIIIYRWLLCSFQYSKANIIKRIVLTWWSCQKIAMT